MAVYKPTTLQKGDQLPPEVQALVKKSARKKSTSSRQSPYSGLWSILLSLISVIYVIPIVLVFINSFKRADDLALAMESRCYRGGEGRTKMRPLKYTARDRARNSPDPGKEN